MLRLTQHGVVDSLVPVNVFFRVPRSWHAVVLLILAACVMVAGVGAGVYWMFNKDITAEPLEKYLDPTEQLAIMHDAHARQSMHDDKDHTTSQMDMNIDDDNNAFEISNSVL